VVVAWVHCCAHPPMLRLCPAGYDQAGSFKSLLSPELRSRLLPPGSSTSQATQFPCVSGDQVPGQPGLYILGEEGSAESWI
jgi:hypothetical protein